MIPDTVPRLAGSHQVARRTAPSTRRLTITLEVEILDPPALRWWASDRGKPHEPLALVAVDYLRANGDDGVVRVVEVTTNG